MTNKMTKHRKLLFIISTLLIIVGTAYSFLVPPKAGIDFIGGTKFEYTINKNNNIELSKKLSNEIFSISTIVYTDDSIIIKAKKSKFDKNELRSKIEQTFIDVGIGFNLVSFDNISPTFGKELLINAIKSIIIAFSLILFYILYRYELIFSISAILTLIHDIIITIFLLNIFSVEINTATIAALLTIIGYSLNDTIVLFERVKNNLVESFEKSLGGIINNGIKENLSRMFLTSLTTLLTVVSLLVFGGDDLFSFSITMFFGIIIGTYSSIFISTSFLEFFNFNVIKYREKHNEKMTKMKEKEELRMKFERANTNF